MTFVVVLFPLGLSPLGYLELMGDTFTRYPYISQYGFNPWGMVFGFGDDDAGVVAHRDGRSPPPGSSRACGSSGDGATSSACSGSACSSAWSSTTCRRASTSGTCSGRSRSSHRSLSIERRLVWPFVALSAAAFLTVAYVAVNSPYRIFPGPRWDDFPAWAISLMSAGTTVVGAWTAYRVLGLFRGGPSEATSGPSG